MKAKFIAFCFLSLLPRCIYGKSDNYEENLGKLSTIVCTEAALQKPTTKSFFNLDLTRLGRKKRIKTFRTLFADHINFGKEHLSQEGFRDIIEDYIEMLKLDALNQISNFEDVNRCIKHRQELITDIRRNLSNCFWDHLQQDLLSRTQLTLNEFSDVHRNIIDEEKEGALAQFETYLNIIIETSLEKYEDLLLHKRKCGYYLLMIDRFASELVLKKVKARGTESYCSICLEDNLDASQMIDAFTCGHKFCLSDTCLKDHINMKAKEQAALECPICGSEANLELLMSMMLISPFLKVQFEFLNLRTIVQNFPSWVHCKTPNCDGGYVDIDDGRSRYDCLLCEKNHCMKCKEDHNRYISCEEFKLQSNHKDPLYLMKKKGLVKNCPKCATPISKADGCLHMTCSKCKYDFRWDTLEKWQGEDWYRQKNGLRINSEVDAGLEEQDAYL